MNNDLHLKPCPFCGNNDKFEMQYCEEPDQNFTKKKRCKMIMCQICGAAAYDTFIGDAIDSWNGRSSFTGIDFQPDDFKKSYEQQANEQGYTLGDSADYFEKIREAWLLLDSITLFTHQESQAVNFRLERMLIQYAKKQGGDNKNVHESC